MSEQEGALICLDASREVAARLARSLGAWYTVTAAGARLLLVPKDRPLEFMHSPARVAGEVAKALGGLYDFDAQWFAADNAVVVALRGPGSASRLPAERPPPPRRAQGALPQLVAGLDLKPTESERVLRASEALYGLDGPDSPSSLETRLEVDRARGFFVLQCFGYARINLAHAVAQCPALSVGGVHPELRCALVELRVALAP